MDWAPLIVATILLGIFLLRRVWFISREKAQKLLQNGAVIVDVRSPAEFQSSHLPGAVNLPLADLPNAAPRYFQDKDQVLLLHCLSGTRSGIAKRQLAQLGYRDVFNLGSYGRAETILRSSVNH